MAENGLGRDSAPGNTPDNNPISEPGIYPGLPFADYLAIDALSASGIRTLLTSFPARLKCEQEPTQALEDGRIAHSLVLEGVDEVNASGRYIVVPKGFSLSHVKKHEELIDRIASEGLTPISEDRVATIHGMANALREDPAIRKALSNGQSEVTAVWRDEETGILCKARFDWWPNKGALLPDYKTAASIDPAELSRSVFNYHLAHRSAWYSDAARIAGGRGSEEQPPLYLPIFQEKRPPYFAVMRPVEPRHVDMVRSEVRMAVKLYAYCKEQNHWPGPQHFKPVELPGWYVRQLEYLNGEPSGDEWSDAA